MTTENWGVENMVQQQQQQNIKYSHTYTMLVHL